MYPQLRIDEETRDYLREISFELDIPIYKLVMIMVQEYANAQS